MDRPRSGGPGLVRHLYNENYPMPALPATSERWTASGRGRSTGLYRFDAADRPCSQRRSRSATLLFSAPPGGRRSGRG